MAPLQPRNSGNRETSVTPVYDTDQRMEGDLGQGPKTAGAEAVRTLPLARKLLLCMGLTASEAMGVFSNLNELPLLQALKCPVYLMTLPGAISSTCGLVFVPLVGWLGDRGPNPQKRKKPITVASFFVGLLGMGLNLLACLLSIWGGSGSRHNNSTSSVTNESFLHNSTTTIPTTMPQLVHNHSLLSTHNISTLLSDLNETATTSSQFPGSSNDYNTATTVSAEVGTDSVGLAMTTVFGLPVVVLVSMAGFVFMDFGFDLTNSGVKALMLTHSPPADHMSLVVIGVFMAALGGCCTSVSGLVDLGSLFPDVNVVFSQATVQLTTLIILGVLCCSCTVLSAPSLVSSRNLPKDEEHLCGDLFASQDESSRPRRNSGAGVRKSSVVVVRAETAPENAFLAAMTPAEALMSNSVQIERSFMHLSTSLSHSHHLLSLHPHHHHKPPPPDSEKSRLLLRENSQYEAIPEDSEPSKRSQTEGLLDSAKLQMFVLWLAAFFTGCATFVYNVTIADYIGKVVYGGDPQADEDSEEYALYQKGMRTGAMCVLIMNLSYVASALSQNKVLSRISPKTEYVLISLSLTLLMTVMHQTSHMYAIIVCSIVVGLNRTGLYTVPFLLATELCQYTPTGGNVTPEDEEEQEKENNSKFGSTMALMTAAFPSAYLTISCIIGPLVDATGDPSSPLLIAVVTSVLSALTICCYRPLKKT